MWVSSLNLPQSCFIKYLGQKALQVDLVFHTGKRGLETGPIALLLGATTSVTTGKTEWDLLHRQEGKA